MRGTRLVTMLGLLVVFSAPALAGCGATATPTPTECDDIPASIGGCSSARPVYTGTTCREFAEQWGRSVDTAVLRIATEPEVLEERQRSARTQDAMILATVALGLHLDAQGRLGECTSDAVLAGADGAFTQAMRDAIPAVLYDNLPAATWDQFEFEARKVLKVLDVAPTAP